MNVDFHDLSVFTRDGVGGNPLAVIPFGSVPSSHWQEVATAIGYSETVFVEAGEPATVHIYTPGGRIPFAGHPLVGTAHTLEGTSRIRYDTGVADITKEGEVVSVTVISDGEIREAAVPPFGMKASTVGMPLPYLVVEAPDVATVSGLQVDDVAHLGGEVYVWAWDEAQRTVRARFFAPTVGVPEDPATGSAAVALARVMGAPTGDLLIRQGEEMGKPSEIRLAWDTTRVTIGGTVADLGSSSIEI